METPCNQQSFAFQQVGRRDVVARFDGGRVTSDGGAILLREIEERFGFIKQFAACFTDHRDPQSIEHPVSDLPKRRLFGLCLRYEDLNDHDWLRHDAMLAVLVGKEDPRATTGSSRGTEARPWPATGRQVQHRQVRPESSSANNPRGVQLLTVLWDRLRRITA